MSLPSWVFFNHFFHSISFSLAPLRSVQFDPVCDPRYDLKITFELVNPTVRSARADSVRSGSVQFTMRLTTLPISALLNLALGCSARSNAYPFQRITTTTTTTSYNGISFVLVGDSTTHSGTLTLNSGGWAEGFCGSLTGGTFCSDRSSNGKTTGTIVSEGFWDLALADVQNETEKGNKLFVTIQFGHNDMKIAPPESMAANLTSFVHQLNNLGANPVLVTALSRRNFNNATGLIADTLGPWANATIDVAHATGSALLPLHEVSIAYLESIGQSASQILNRSPDDRTHLNLAGQFLFGRMVADLMRVFILSDSDPSPFTIDSDLSLALYTGKQYAFEPVYQPGHNATY
ncbi:SGNH hydrolase-type esterase domain [Phaffia rhodozyma]|uniref:SGNH hydrolase-type esterase domain n=1 Tax=Phaffia rhodozyma TaxID=264483 RepID=A0A0F7SMX4_PHARH|nr:SGNH hydrolase-type esterase domain [Phaffia rhodozyma]